MLIPLLHDATPFVSEIFDDARFVHFDSCFRYCYDASDRGGSRTKYLGVGAGPSSFGRQQRLSEITIEPITSTSSRTTVA